MDETSVSNTQEDWKAQIGAELCELSAQNLRRELRTVEGMQGPTMRHGGRTLVNLSSNNYLGLAGYPAIIEASVEAARTAGASGAASPLISGHMADHEELARTLAAFKRKDAALVFGSGFLANLGLITALTSEGDAVFSDALNHASIVDGCRLSRAQVHIYPPREPQPPGRRPEKEFPGAPEAHRDGRRVQHGRGFGPSARHLRPRG